MDGERRRRAILEALREARGGLDTKELATALGLHPNTVRWHVGILADGGLVRAEPHGRHGRGRPSLVYRLTSAGATRGRNDYRLLASMLTAALAGDPDGEARGYETGRRRGRHLQAAEPEAGIVELLDRQGFAASRIGDRLEMRRCPFHELAGESPGIVCTLHRGIVDGALEEAGTGERVERLDPFVEPALCVAHLYRERSSAAARKSRAR